MGYEDGRSMAATQAWRVAAAGAWATAAQKQEVLPTGSQAQESNSNYEPRTGVVPTSNGDPESGIQLLTQKTLEKKPQKPKTRSA